MPDTEIRTGDTRETQGRTITDADLVTWAGLVHDFTRLHFDAEYMKETPFGRPIAHGYIAMNLAVGLMFPAHAEWYAPDGDDRTLGWTNVQFLAPVHVGDTLTCRRTVTEVSADEVVYHVEIFNQHQTVAMSGTERVERSAGIQRSEK